jgi:hypothetical protein
MTNVRPSHRSGVPAYGTPNFDMIGRWLALDPADDGPFWAVNLMRYRDIADYGDARTGTAAVSGREADDAYTPVGSLAAIGARIVFAAEVTAQPAGSPGWHRIGIVRYPSRAAFLAMQRRDDFREQHVHKEAGMEFTIVMSATPSGPPAARADGTLVMVALPVDAGDGLAEIGLRTFAEFTVEGVIVGDTRTFGRVLFAQADESALGALHARSSDDDRQVVVLSAIIDQLTESMKGDVR